MQNGDCLPQMNDHPNPDYERGSLRMRLKIRDEHAHVESCTVCMEREIALLENHRHFQYYATDA